MSRWPPPNAAQPRLQAAAVTLAHQTFREVARRTSPHERRLAFAPRQHSRFIYELPKPRDNSSYFDTQMDESRHYLAMGTMRCSSSPADRMLGGAILAACGIALAWLLTATATHDADKPGMIGIARESPAMATATQPQASARTAQPSVEAGPKPATSVRAAAARTPKALLRTQPKTDPKTEPKSPWKPSQEAARPIKPRTITKPTSPRPSEPQFDQLRATTAAIRPALDSAASAQPEWLAPPSPDATDTPAGDPFGNEWLDWRTLHQHDRARSAARTKPSAAASSDMDWSARMTQRRITDNPSAFSAFTALSAPN
ncbi:hypothetical protein [Paraburkholderia sp. DGU8]|uniref:hypothetical protein n=1 Tax=Paraburkholderia sp. DGU8 TaxID=3161997 RepID=UPI0034671952